VETIATTTYNQRELDRIIPNTFAELEPAEQLDQLTKLALSDYNRILAIPLHHRPRDEWGMWLRAKLRASRDVLAARLRVDENSLRRKQLDALPELLRMMAEAKAENPKLDL
jgi:hypothetical protein